MPLPREQFSVLLNGCTDPNERLLALLIRDLEGQKVRLAKFSTSDIDQVSRLLRVKSENGTIHSILLSPETVQAFRDSMRRRMDRDPSLFMSASGQVMGEEELRSWARMIGARSGFEFDESRLAYHGKESGTAESGRIVVKGASRDLFYLYGVISHPLRRRIVELLGDEGPLGFTQIINRLNVRVGTLYYHFDMLAGLIFQDGQKRYALTAAGREAYAKLHSNEYVEAATSISNSPAVSEKRPRVLRRLVMLGWLLNMLQNRAFASVVGTVAVLTLGVALLIYARLETVALFLNPSLDSPLILAGSFLLNWVGIYAVADLLASYLFGRRGEHIPLLLGTAYAMVPLVLFASWWTLVTDFAVNFPVIGTFGFSRVVLVLLQAVSLLLLARMVSVLKGLRLDKAALISLTIAYLSITIAYFRGG